MIFIYNDLFFGSIMTRSSERFFFKNPQRLFPIFPLGWSLCGGLLTLDVCWDPTSDPQLIAEAWNQSVCDKSSFYICTIIDWAEACRGVDSPTDLQSVSVERLVCRWYSHLNWESHCVKTEALKLVCAALSLDDLLNMLMFSFKGIIHQTCMYTSLNTRWLSTFVVLN